MNGNNPQDDDLQAAVRATELGCEAFFVPDKDGERPGHWHFNQKYDEGIIWKRLRWPWIALRGTLKKSDIPTQNFSTQLQNAESYLKDAFPNALIPRSLLNETLRDAYSGSTETFSAAQGQLLDLGITRYVQRRDSGRRVGGQWKRLCVAFCSGELRTDVSIALIRWCTTNDESETKLRVPFLTERSPLEVTFKRPVQQIVFPAPGRYEDLCDFFAVRTMTEVAILTCSRTEDKRAFVQQCMTLPLPSTGHMKSKYVADTAFNSSGSQIATVTDRGFWTVYDLSIPAKTVSLAASGWLELPELSAEENRNGWWKVEWIEETNDLLVAESEGLHLLNFNAGSSDVMMSPNNNEHFRGLAVIDALGGIAYAVLTTSEILIVESSDWAILLRQKHQRDLDPSLVMKIFSTDDVTNIFLYSRLNPLITVHQLSEDLPLSWLDTPFELPLPRRDPALPTAGPNLGLVIIPSNVILNNEETVTTGEETCFTTYRLQPDLSIVGDMYGTQDTSIQSFVMKSFVKRTEALSPRLTTDAESENEEERTRFQSKRKTDFSLVADEILSNTPVAEMIKKKPHSRLRTEISEAVKQTEFRVETMRKWKSADMIAMDPDSLTSTIEQVGHRLEEGGYQIRPLHVIAPSQDFDPENDPGSISSIYSSLMSKLSSRGLDTSEVKSKLQSMRDIAVDVGLANIGVVKSNATSEAPSLHNLRKFLDVDPTTNISTAAEFVLAEWGMDPQPTKPKQTVVRKRKRVRVAGSQNEVGDVVMSQPLVEIDNSRSLSQMDRGTMSQPERGIHGTMTLRERKPRKAGF